LWFGQTETAMLFVVVMGTLWSVVIATGDRRAQRPADLPPRRFDHGVQAVPHLVQGYLARGASIHRKRNEARWAFAWRSLMAAEIFVTILTGFGLGQLLHYGRELNAMEQVIGIMIVIVVIGLLADKIFFFTNRKVSAPALGDESGMRLGHKRAPTSAQREVRITNKLGLHARARRTIR